MKRKVYWMVFEKYQSTRFSWTSEIFNKSHYPHNIWRLYKWLVIDYLYIVQVTSWRCFSRILPQLTKFVVNFEISSTVPVCCVPFCYKRFFIPVEQKKVRIWHKLLYVKYRKPSCFEDFTPSVWPSWKAAINKTVKWMQ